MTPSRPGPDQLPAAALARADDDLERLVGYVQHETPTGDRAALDGFGEVLLADAVASGASTRRVPLPDGDVLVVEHPGRDRPEESPALVLAHHDTVHPAGSLRGAVPLRREGDTLFGPGTYDMKGGIVVLLAALELLAGLGLPHRPVRLVVTPDEEVGSPTSRDVVTDLARGVAFALGLEPPHADGALKTSRMGSTRLRLSVTGRSAHAALNPELGVSATDELVDQLLRTRALVAEHPDVLCNLGSLGGEGKTNVVAAAAHADLGLRFLTSQTETEVLGRLASLEPVREGARVSTTVLSSRPAWGPS
ncbi:MAG TPA: M20/M25/M40 family metallo-hydrolase, partial [Actinomycetales bacterium]